MTDKNKTNEISETDLDKVQAGAIDPGAVFKLQAANLDAGSAQASATPDKVTVRGWDYQKKES